MKVAELCDTAPSYIGEIEIGRRFPSLKLIEKIGQVLEVEPYRFFIDETNVDFCELDETINLMLKLSEKQRLSIINRISASLMGPLPVSLHTAALAVATDDATGTEGALGPA